MQRARRGLDRAFDYERPTNVHVCKIGRVVKPVRGDTVPSCGGMRLVATGTPARVPRP